MCNCTKPVLTSKPNDKQIVESFKVCFLLLLISRRSVDSNICILISYMLLLLPNYKKRSIVSLYHHVINHSSLYHLARKMWFFSMPIWGSACCYCFFFIFPWAKSLTKTSSLTSQGRDKIYVHSTIHNPTLWNYTGFVILVVVIDYMWQWKRSIYKKKAFSFLKRRLTSLVIKYRIKDIKCVFSLINTWSAA